MLLSINWRNLRSYILDINNIEKRCYTFVFLFRYVCFYAETSQLQYGFPKLYVILAAYYDEACNEFVVFMESSKTTQHRYFSTC